jgi:hypothetical protein
MSGTTRALDFSATIAEPGSWSPNTSASRAVIRHADHDEPIRPHGFVSGGTVTALVDSLDEALMFSPERSITHSLPLEEFPSQVRFIVTSRSHNQRVSSRS